MYTYGTLFHRDVLTNIIHTYMYMLTSMGYTIHTTLFKHTYLLPQRYTHPYIHTYFNRDIHASIIIHTYLHSKIHTCQFIHSYLLASIKIIHTRLLPWKCTLHAYRNTLIIFFRMGISSLSSTLMSGGHRIFR